MNKMACLWFFLSILIGAVLFQTTQRVSDGRQKLFLLTQSLQDEEETLRVLQAEWSYLNQPDRLEKLSREYLKLSPMKGRQFARADSLPLRPVPIEPAQDEAAMLLAAAQIAPSPPEILMQAATTPPRPPLRKPPLRKPSLHATSLEAVSPPPQHPLVKTTPTQPAARTASQNSRRDFSDVIQSLGVANP